MHFDREYRKVKRSHAEDLKVGIAETETQNPKDFWNELKSLGRGISKIDLPSGVTLENGEVVTDKQAVLNKWKQDFCSLRNPTNTQDSVNLDIIWIHEPNDFRNSEDLNSPITLANAKECFPLPNTEKLSEYTVFRTKFSKMIVPCFYYVPFSKTVSLVIVYRRYGRNQL